MSAAMTFNKTVVNDTYSTDRIKHRCMHVAFSINRILLYYYTE